MKQNWNCSSRRTTILTLTTAALLGLSVFPSVCSPRSTASRPHQIAAAPGTELTKPQASIEPMRIPFSPAPALSECDNKVAANVMDMLSLRAEPSTEGRILGKCYRGSGGVILEQKDSWTKVRSGKLEGWLKNDYLVFGQDIKPLAKELGLFTAEVTTQTLNVCEEPSTEPAIVGFAAGDDYYPVLEEKDGWAKIQLASDSSGHISTQYTRISVTPSKAVSIEAEQVALKAAEQKQGEKQEKKKEEEKSKYVIKAPDDEVYLMAACVMMESGGYSYDGQLAVANVIVNCVKSGRWGGSITDVIYAQGQFPGASSGLLDRYLAKGPPKSVLKAVRVTLSGINNIGDYLFFQSTKAADHGSYSSYTVVGGNCSYKK